MKKGQSIDERISALPRDEQVIVRRLRSLIIECLPGAKEKSYDDIIMPFYTGNRVICFILPPSVSWTPDVDNEKQKTKGVALGFNQGNLMSHDGVLQAEGRKQVYKIYFKNFHEIDEMQLRALLFEAAMIDEGFKKK